MQEYKICNEAHFVTLTYAPEYMTIEMGNVTPNGFMTLNKKHVQDYMKRLRYHEKRLRKRFKWKKEQDKAFPVKYYAVGEYGTANKRPHYHLLIFNACKQAITLSWKKDGNPIGNVHIDKVNMNTIKYTLKYMDKANNKLPYNFAAFDGVKQFNQQSTKLGENYLQKKHVVEWHRESTDRNFLINDRGFKIAMPRYYSLKIWPEGAERDKLLFDIQKAVKEAEKEDKQAFEKKRLYLQGYNYDTFKDMQRFARYNDHWARHNIRNL